jgi:hypothetical protein
LPAAIEPRHPDGQPSWLADELNLRPEQRAQMDAIWAEAKGQSDKSFERRQGLDRERDQAIQELLTPAEWQAYDKIIEEFRAKRVELDKERGQVMHDANEKSLALLDDDQKQKWKAMRNLHDHRGPHGPGGPVDSTKANSAPTTREANQ